MRALSATRLLLAALALLAFAGLAVAAEPNFPALTGRVVDGAGVISVPARQRIEQKLAAYEQKTSDQIVVATVPSLQDLPIEDFANRLFRFWKLGQAKTNNGVLLLIAPSERKLRIEVGYGLEGSLTDALSRIIISGAIAPKFKTGDYAGGIDAGVDAIIATLSGDDEWRKRAAERPQPGADSIDPVAVILLIVLFIFIYYKMTQALRRGRDQTHYTRNGQWIVFPSPSSGSGGGSWGGSSGGSSDSGFSGGGGSSGGGGASGDW